MTDKQAFVKRICFDDVQVSLPEVEPWDGDEVSPDLLISALGFEDRASAIPQLFAERLPQGGAAIALLGCYDINTQDNEGNGDAIRGALSRFCSEIRTFSAESPHEVQCAVQAALQELRQSRQKVRVAFDISGASSTLILSVLATLIPQAPRLVLDIVYAEPEEYAPPRFEYESRLEELVQEALLDGDDSSFAEQGVSDVDVNELYPGLNAENRPDRVIALPSLRTSRLVRCLAHISDQPLVSPVSSIFWILGEPPASSMRWRLDLQRRIVNRQLAVMVGKEPSDTTAPSLCERNHHTCSTRDYRQTLGTLVSQIDQSAGSNVWLIHMGSKLQAVGVALALQVRNEVTVLRARPKQFNAGKYSSGVGTLWRLHFEDLAGVLGRLQQIGELELETKIETSRERRPSC
ncbi:hypothetical protein [Ralstonia mannitolilytica]|uniref:Uncharacterized protein n=1 Tax=Ralstonia mannitolilytica TaxID=105219 RepID=A0AAD2EGB2_9RALS|nr:hypothetical protein [Ralstonia mannitolilytica]MBY4718255.1 hypothetical protein [Ralstonia mannitolilytica]CAJ0681542.1 hypothetical protein R77591_01393 [Ralstonia mannitolilytica]